MKFYKQNNTIPIYNFHKILYDSGKNIKYLIIDHDTYSKYELNIYLLSNSKKAKKIFAKLQKDYMGMNFNKRELTQEKARLSILHLRTQKMTLLEILKSYFNYVDIRVLKLITGFPQFKKVEFKDEMTNEEIQAIVDKIDRDVKTLTNKINIEEAKYKSKYTTGTDDGEVSGIDIFDSLDKMALGMERYLELGYNIDVKKTSVLRWVNLMEAQEEKSRILENT